MRCHLYQGQSRIGRCVYIMAGFALLFFPVSGFCATEPNQGVWLRYESEGGFSPYEKLVILINREGRVSAEITRRSASSYTYTTGLSAEELASLETLIRAVDFYSQPEKDSALTIDGDTALLSIQMDGKSRELVFRYRPQLEPLVSYMQRILIQAEALRHLAQAGNAYPLLNAVSGRLNGIRALQPGVFVLPLKSFLSTSDNERNLEWAIEGFAWVVGPEEWSGYLAMTLAGADKTRRQILMSILSSRPFCDNIPVPHLQALCPLLLAYLVQNHGGQPILSDADKRIHAGALAIIGEAHYWPALPYLETVFDCQDKPEITSEMAVIAQMGKRGVILLSSCLDKTSVCKRLNAVEMMGMVYRRHRYGRQSGSIDDYEYSQMVKLFNERIGEQLQTLAQKDTSQNVRSQAEKTLQNIQAEIEIWRSRTKEIGI